MKVSIVLFTKNVAALVKGLAVSESFLVLCTDIMISTIIHLPLSCPLQVMVTEPLVARFVPLGLISHQLVHIDVLFETKWHWELINFPRFTDILQEWWVCFWLVSRSFWVQRAFKLLMSCFLTDYRHGVFSDFAIFFSLIVISYVRKCFRGGTYPEITSYILVNNCEKFGAFVHYVPISSKFLL